MSATGQLHGRLRAVCRVRCHTSGEPTGGRTFWSFEPSTQWVGGTKCPARSRPHDDRPNQSSIYEGARSPDQVADEATAPSRPANWSSALADHPPLGSVSPVSESRSVTGHRSGFGYRRNTAQWRVVSQCATPIGWPARSSGFISDLIGGTSAFVN